MTGLLELDDKLAIWIPLNGTADPGLQRLAPRRGARGKARQCVGQALAPALDVEHVAVARRIAPGRLQQEHAQKLTLALVSRGEVEENKNKAQEHGLSNVLLQRDWEVSESYEVSGTPSAVLISPDGKIASPVAGGDEGIRGLLSYAVGERAQLPMQPHQPQTEGQPCPNCGKVHAAAPTVPAALPLGEPAPEVGQRVRWE